MLNKYISEYSHHFDTFYYGNSTFDYRKWNRLLSETSSKLLSDTFKIYLYTIFKANYENPEI
jgi:hypothetical protein